jgi:hypothetical protein
MFLDAARRALGNVDAIQRLARRLVRFADGVSGRRAKLIERIERWV